MSIEFVSQHLKVICKPVGMFYVTFLLPIFGYCLSFQQAQISEIQKDLVRQALLAEYQPVAIEAKGNLYSFQMAANDTKETKEIKPAKGGGTWTGGGGSGFACFDKAWESHKDKKDFLLPNSYESMNKLSVLDFMGHSEDNPYMLAKPGETSIEYIRRVFSKVYGPVLPLFSEKVIRISEVIYDQLQEQKEVYKKKPTHNSQPTLRDFGYLMLQKEFTFPHQCKIVQMATRYAQIELHKVLNFFIDFDVHLVLRMQELADTPEVGVTEEASLILHEALYLMGSVVEHFDSSATTFRILPLLLAQKTQLKIAGLSRVEAANYLRHELGQYGMKNYHFVNFVQEVSTSNSDVNMHFSALKQIKRSLSDAESEFKKKYYFQSMDMRQEQIYLKNLVDQLEKNTTPPGAFIALSSLIDAKFNYILDDLFIESVDQKAAVLEFCKNIKLQKWDLLGDHPYANMQKVYDRALQYCEK